MAGVDLLASIERHTEGAFVWGITDCFCTASRVLDDTCGIDPASDHRGAYSTENGALRIIAPYGGLLGFMRERMGAFGWGEAQEKTGAIGIVQGHDGKLIVANCIKPGLWAAKAPMGYATTDKLVVSFWAF